MNKKRKIITMAMVFLIFLLSFGDNLFGKKEEVTLLYTLQDIIEPFSVYEICNLDNNPLSNFSVVYINSSISYNGSYVPTIYIQEKENVSLKKYEFREIPKTKGNLDLLDYNLTLISEESIEQKMFNKTTSNETKERLKKLNKDECLTVKVGARRLREKEHAFLGNFLVDNQLVVQGKIYAQYDYYNVSCQQMVSHQIIHNENYTYPSLEFNISLDTSTYGWTSNPNIFLVRNDTNEVLKYYNFSAFGIKNTELWTNTTLGYNKTFEIEIYYSCFTGYPRASLKDIFSFAIDGETNNDLADTNRINTVGGFYTFNTTYRYTGSRSVQSNKSSNPHYVNLENINGNPSVNTNLSNFVSKVSIFFHNYTGPDIAMLYLSNDLPERYIGAGIHTSTNNSDYVQQVYNLSGTDILPINLSFSNTWGTLEEGINETSWWIILNNGSSTYSYVLEYNNASFATYPPSAKNIYFSMGSNLTLYDDWFIRYDRGNKNPTINRYFVRLYSNQSPIILENYTTPDPLRAHISSFLSVNISDPRNNRITAVYFNLTAPNGTLLFGSQNATIFSGNWNTSSIWNSTTYIIPNVTGSIGQWSYEYSVHTNTSDYYRTISNFSVTDIQAPTLVNITNPENNSVSLVSDIPVNFSYIDDYGVYNCWYKLDNGTNTSIANCLNFTISSVSLANHNLSVTVNDTGGNMRISPVINFTVSNDNSQPVITITSPTQGSTLSSKTISLEGTITENYRLDNCTYNIYRGASAEVANTSFGCSLTSATFSTSAVVSSDADYRLNVYAYDNYSNVGYQQVNFSVSTSPVPGSQGGGGVTATTIISGECPDGNLFDVLSKFGTKSMKYTMGLGGVRNNEFVLVTNLQSYNLTIDSSVIKKEENGSDFIKIKNDTLLINPTKRKEEPLLYSLNVPNDVIEGDYYPNLNFYSKTENCEQLLIFPIEIKVGGLLGVFSNLINKLENTSGLIAVFGSFLLAVIISLWLFKAIYKDKRPTGLQSLILGLIALSGGGLASFIVLLLI